VNRPTKTTLLRALVALGAALALAAPASAAGTDGADTHALIGAAYALAKASHAGIPVVQAKIERLNLELAAECPDAGAGTLENEASEPMTYEVAVALWSVEFDTLAGPIKRFVSSVKPLRLPSARFDRVLRSYASNLLGLATIPRPDLCADIRSWAASGFRTVPANVLALDQRVGSLELPELPWNLLARYETKSDANLVPFIKRAERNVEEEEFLKGQDDYYRILKTVGLPP